MNILKLKLKDILGAVVSAVIVAVLGYLSNLTNITEIDVNQLLNISLLTAVSSLLKVMGTNNDGVFLGAVKVK